MSKHHAAYDTMLAKAFELYKRDWCKERNHTLDNWNDEHGFNGESFSCMTEFEGAEFTDRDYMEYLLPETDFLLWDAWWHAPDIVVVLRRGAIDEVRSSNPFTTVLIADYDILENGPRDEEVLALQDAEKRAADDDMHQVR